MDPFLFLFGGGVVVPLFLRKWRNGCGVWEGNQAAYSIHYVRGHGLPCCHGTVSGGTQRAEASDGGMFHDSRTTRKCGLWSVLRNGWRAINRGVPENSRSGVQVNSSRPQSVMRHSTLAVSARPLIVLQCVQFPSIRPRELPTVHVDRNGRLKRAVARRRRHPKLRHPTQIKRAASLPNTEVQDTSNKIVERWGVSPYA